MIDKIKEALSLGLSCAELCNHAGSAMYIKSVLAEYEQKGLEQQLAALAPESYAVQVVALIDMLRRDAGHGVEVLCDNEEGNGPDNCAVEVTADWTGYEPKRFYGQTVLAALQAAYTASRSGDTHG